MLRFDVNLCESQKEQNTKEKKTINHKQASKPKLPSTPPGRLIGSPPSRRHVMVGAGEPVATHLSVTLLPSVTTISVLVG